MKTPRWTLPSPCAATHIYIHPDSMKALRRDLKAFYAKAAPGSD
ncbi:MAG: hypothetical protein V2I82_15950 [Halieaceae bacterium]|nr:hypothetical protein [Halieaceae bacterium]